MEEFDNCIYNAINRIRDNRRQPNEDALFDLLTHDLESLNKDDFINRLTYLVETKAIINKPCGGRNSYYVGRQLTDIDETPHFEQW